MSRPLLVVLAVAFVAPFAHADAAPEQSATASSYDLVLNEPVTFTDTSTGGGGVAESRWTDVDGREHVGATFVYRFAFAGNHEVGLRTTFVNGAEATMTLRVLVRAPILRGHAVAVRHGGTTMADTGEVAVSGQTTVSDSVGEVRNGALRVAALDAEVVTLDAITRDARTLARADAGFVHVPHPLGSFRATGVESEVIAGCSGASGVARFSQLRFNDAPLVPRGEVAPNTRLALPGGGEVVLNVQEATPYGGLSVTALRVVDPDGGVTEVARAEGGVEHCPFPT